MIHDNPQIQRRARRALIDHIFGKGLHKKIDDYIRNNYGAILVLLDSSWNIATEKTQQQQIVTCLSTRRPAPYEAIILISPCSCSMMTSHPFGTRQAHATFRHPLNTWEDYLLLALVTPNGTCQAI